VVPTATFASIHPSAGKAYSPTFLSASYGVFVAGTLQTQVAPHAAEGLIVEGQSGGPSP
jgi:hypothetical protein